MFPLLPASFPTVGGFSHHHLQLGVYPFKSFSTHIQTSTYKYAHYCWKLFFGFCFVFFTKMNSYYIYWSATCFFFSFKTIAQKVFSYEYLQIYLFLLNSCRAWMHHHLFNRFPLVRQLSCLQFFTITKQVAKNTLFTYSRTLIGVFLWGRSLEAKLLGRSQVLSFCFVTF